MAIILDNKTISIIISLIWGLGIALLFRKVCKNDKCELVKVAPEFEKGDNIITDGKDKCYKLQKYIVECQE